MPNGVAAFGSRIFLNDRINIRQEVRMKLIDTEALPTLEKLPGWHGKLFHSEAMTFAHWQFDAGAVIHEHSHQQEEVWHVMQGELEALIDGQSVVAGPGMVLILAPHQLHSIVARSAGMAVVADHPSRRDFG
jgi:quercetin dioxygenase-like cupin family protein